MARRTSYAARLWKAFFEQLKKAGYPQANETEVYVSIFSESFNLAKAPYQLGDRIVML